jgi:hypothetical protein
MWWKLKNYTLVICLFVFLLVVIGNGLHLTPAASLIAAMSGTPLVIFTFSCWHDEQCREENARSAFRVNKDWERR